MEAAFPLFAIAVSKLEVLVVLGVL